MSVLYHIPIWDLIDMDPMRRQWYESTTNRHLDRQRQMMMGAVNEAIGKAFGGG